MDSKPSKFKFLSYTLMEHWSVRFLDAITTIVLIRNLNLNSLGSFVIYQSWVAVLLFLFPPLESILYREYARLRDEKKLAFELATYRKFNAIKFVFAVFLLFLCSWLPVVGVPDGVGYLERLAALGLALALPLSQSLYGIYRETLRFELKQERILLLCILQRVCLIAAVWGASHFWAGDIRWIALWSIVIFFIFGFCWAYSLRALLPHLKKERAAFSDMLPRVQRILSDAVLWIHINGAATIAIQTLDVYFLSRTKIEIADLAIYSIAVKAANFFQIIPVPFAQAFGVYLGRKSSGETPKEAMRLVMLASLGFLFLGALMYSAGILFSAPLMAFLSKGKFTAEELARGQVYFKWQILGVVNYLLSYATGAYISGRGHLKGLTLSVFIPWFTFSILGYYFVSQYGTLATAKFNVPVYLFCWLGHAVYFMWWVKEKR